MTFIIAEAGVNHNGSLELAKRLVDVAAEAGVDAVKFQTWKTELLVTPNSALADYQKESTSGFNSQFDMLKQLELTYDNFRELKEYCDQKKILFLSTPDESVSADFLNSIQPMFKIASGDLTNIPFLRHIAAFGKPIILSTGMGSLDEVHLALHTLQKAGVSKDAITLLHANTEYPTPFEDVNLRAMQTLKEKFGLKTGLSDHSPGIEVPIAATALGATVIEKHFTLDKTMTGPDHSASLSPDELSNMVRAIRYVELAMGSGIKIASASEQKNISVSRKSMVAGKLIAMGEKLTSDNLAVKRPGTGISPAKWDQVVGRKANRDYQPDEMLEEEILND